MTAQLTREGALQAAKDAWSAARKNETDWGWLHPHYRNPDPVEVAAEAVFVYFAPLRPKPPVSWTDKTKPPWDDIDSACDGLIWSESRQRWELVPDR